MMHKKILWGSLILLGLTGGYAVFLHHEKISEFSRRAAPVASSTLVQLPKTIGFSFNQARQPVLKEFVPRVSFVALDNLPEQEQQTAKNAYFSALMDYFHAHPEALSSARDYVLSLNPDDPSDQDKITLVISAMNRQASHEAESTLIELLEHSRSEQDIVIFQSAMSLGGHLAPTEASLQALWLTYNKSEMQPETRSAALMALGAVAAHLDKTKSLVYQEELKKLAKSGNPYISIDALGAMANHGEASYAASVKDILSHAKRPEVRAQALQTLARVDKVDALGILSEAALKEPDANVRLSAARSLALLEPSARGMQQVREIFLGSEDDHVKQSLLEAMARLGRDDSNATKNTMLAIQGSEQNPQLKNLAASYAASASVRPEGD